MSQRLKDKLTKPLIVTQFELIKQLLPIGAATLPVNYCHTYYDHISGKCVLNLTKEADYSHDKVGFPEKFVPLELADHDPSIAKSSFVKGPSTYMVTDSLFVSLMSSISTMSFLKRSKVRLSDLEERVIKIGVKEVSIFTRHVIYRYLFSFAYFKLTSFFVKCYRDLAY